MGSADHDDHDVRRGVAPIALFVYNRPEHTRRTLDHLARNHLAGESHLHVFSDGPRTGADVAAVEAVRRIIRAETRFASVTVREQFANRGLAASIVEGVTDLVARFGRVIVLEDDLLTAPAFLAFMNDALDRYAGNAAVMQISGYLAPIAAAHPERAGFLPLTSSWGWATWKRAWDRFDPSGSGHVRLAQEPALRQAFDAAGAYNYSGMLRDSLEGRNTSWAIRWYLSVFLEEGLVLYPGRSLVRNIGFDGSGVHCGTSSAHDTPELGGDVAAYPDEVAVDADRWAAVRAHLAAASASSRKQPRTRLAAALRSLGRAASQPVRKTRQAWGRVRRAVGDRLAMRIHGWALHGQGLATKHAFGREACVAPDAIVFPEARVSNLARDPQRIRVDGNTAVRGELLVFAHGGDIGIGRHCYIGEGSRIWSSEGISIGDRVLISHGVNIHDTNSHPVDARERHRHFVDILRSGHPRTGIRIGSKRIVIEDDAWIGFNAIIMKGVTVGRGAIVAAGAVVVADVAPWTAVAGNPARIIKHDVTSAHAA